MRVLLVVPLPPPITGHSLASQALLGSLARGHATTVVNLSVGSSNDGRVSARRIREVGKVLLAVWRYRNSADVIYFTISESRAGNLKDLLVYLLCVRRLDRMFVHLHGGTIGRALFDRHPVWRRLNAWFIGRLGGVIVTGPAHAGIFAGMIDPERIHAVPNGVEDRLFVEEGDILAKFADPVPLRVLYLSGMTLLKGYLDVLDAWLRLGPDRRPRIRLDFAGRFDSDADRVVFEHRIAGVEGIHYHGVVEGDDKRRLFARAHVFCLPTAMFEGQPISILEAYASGCVVVTTGQSGIRDVFHDGVNGFEVPEGSGASIAGVLARVLDDMDRSRHMALGNRRAAGERYRTATFTSSVTRILENGKAPR